MVSFKKLILCCDGTWQASDKPADDKNVESNVTKMCRALAEAKIQSGGDEVQQVVYYQSGIGTDIISDWGAKFAGQHTKVPAKTLTVANPFCFARREWCRPL